MIVTLAAGLSGVVVGVVAALMFRRPTPMPALAPPIDPDVQRELDAVRALCDLPAGATIPRHRLALDAESFTQELLGSVVRGSTAAAVVTAGDGMVWGSAGEPWARSVAASFAARLGGVAEEVWRVTWRSDAGVEVVAQRTRVHAGTRWLTCLSEGVPADRVALARVGISTGLMAAMTGSTDPRRRIGAAELAAFEPLQRLSKHVALHSATFGAPSGGVVGVGHVLRSSGIGSITAALERWAPLVRDELGAPLGIVAEGPGYVDATHVAPDGRMLWLEAAAGTPYPWVRAASVAREMMRLVPEREAA